MFRTSKTPNMRVEKTVPPTTRVSKYYSTYQGTSMGSTSIYIPIAIYLQRGPYITINKLPSVCGFKTQCTTCKGFKDFFKDII